MKIVTVFGSPRKKGNTATVVGWMEDALTAAGHEVERVHLPRVDMSGCVSCFQCQMSEEFTCALKDEGNAMYDKMKAADAVVLATPLYWFGPSAQIKPLIDRLMSQVKGEQPNQKSSLAGTRLGLVMTSWGPVEDNSEGLQTMYKKTAEYLLADDRGMLLVPGCAPTEPPSEEAKPQAEAFAATLVG